MTHPLNSYLLDKLQEECAEVIQAVSKIRRFGAQNHHPDRQTTNLEELIGELEDALAIVRVLEHHNYLTLNQGNIYHKTHDLLLEQ
jgi:NTP pyrophosphatase (non-canonical NTP hydrolase)